MKVRLVGFLIGVLVIVAFMVSNDVIARATTFDSPLPPLCEPGGPTRVDCLPWRPTPPTTNLGRNEGGGLQVLGVGPVVTVEATRIWAERPMRRVDEARRVRVVGVHRR